ncbi:MAG: hypothetical protein OHK0046_17480 [Anaerolineae bacterium]
MKRRNQIMLGSAIIAILVIAAAYPLWSPLFINDVVDEAFPTLTTAQRNGVRAMTEDEQETLLEMAEDNADMANQTALAMLEDDTEMAEDMPEADPIVLFTGMFNQFDPIHRGNGTATIYELADGSRILRLEDFATSNGPDLYVRLVQSVPANIFEDTGDYIELGPLKGNVGNQNYSIPDEVDLTAYEAVLIYCLPFRVNFTVAAFE